MPMERCRCGAGVNVEIGSWTRCSLCGERVYILVTIDTRPGGISRVGYQTVEFSRVEDPFNWAEDLKTLDEKPRWSAPDFWLCEKALSPARKIKIPGVRQDRKRFTRYVTRHDALGKVATHMRGKETFVWRERVWTSDGESFTIELGEKALAGCSDPIAFRMNNLRRYLERRQIDLQPFLDAKGL